MAYVAGPFSTPHVLIQWGGKLPGNEEWSCSIRAAQTVHPLGSSEVPTLPALYSWLTGSIKDAVLSYHQRVVTGISPAAKLSYVKANRIDINGLYMDQVTNEYLYPDYAGGGNGGALMPNQATIAVSLTTGFSRGPAHRGRFYLPLPSILLDPDGRISGGSAGALAGSTKTFIEALADVPGLDTPERLKPCVMSRKAGAATHREITGVDVGRVIDTQRRRRRSLNEEYMHTTLELGAA